MRMIALGRGLAVAAALTLSACADTPREVMMNLQGVFNASVAAENLYAAQPFCGSEGALPPPGCADPELVVSMSEGTHDAKDVIDAGWDAVNDPNFDPKSLPSILNSVSTAVGKLRGILARHEIAVSPAVPATQ